MVEFFSFILLLYFLYDLLDPGLEIHKLKKEQSLVFSRIGLENFSILSDVFCQPHVNGMLFMIIIPKIWFQFLFLYELYIKISEVFLI